ncbi:YceD family protein [Methylobacterium sp. ID0610]|uniref:YceD family protein n=1 Tax=Methylobacterium carpenticola TaxID=3344827 RepID=UPI0036BE92B4
MTPDSIGPLSRPVMVERALKAGQEIVVEADAEERAALARDFGLPAIHSLTGRFRLAGSLHRLQVTGTVEAAIAQTCVVTLDPFDSQMREEVEVDFAAPDAFAGTPAEDADIPDPIVNGRVDLGSLTAEFLALGLDPYPRKPGVAFEPPEAEAAENPFAGLDRLKGE